MNIVSWLLSHAAGVAVAAWLLDGIHFNGPTSGIEELQEKALPLLAVAVILGLVSMVVKPVVQLLSLPLIVLTVGLFLLVINALMLMLTDWLASGLDLGFHVNGFGTALLGSIIITIVSWGTALVLGDDS